MLLLVLNDEAEGEAAAQEQIVGVEVGLLEHLERAGAYLVEVGACGIRVEQLERRPLLVEVVALLKGGGG